MLHTNNLHHTPLGLSLVLLHPCCCPLHAVILPVLLPSMCCCPPRVAVCPRRRPPRAVRLTLLCSMRCCAPQVAARPAPSTPRCCASRVAALSTPPSSRVAVLRALPPSPRCCAPRIPAHSRCCPPLAVHPALLCFLRCYPPCVAAVIPVLLPVSTILFIFIASFFTHRCCCGLFLNVLGGRCGLKCSKSIR